MSWWWFVLCQILCCLLRICHLICFLANYDEICAVVSLMLQMRKMRYGVVRSFGSGHTALQQPKWDPSSPIPEILPLMTFSLQRCLDISLSFRTPPTNLNVWPEFTLPTQPEGVSPLCFLGPPTPPHPTKCLSGGHNQFHQPLSAVVFALPLTH